MTVEETIRGNLISIGFSETQLNNVMDIIHAHDGEVTDGKSILKPNVLESLPVRWEDDIESVHKVFFAVVYDRVRRIARKWLEIHCPGAWFKEYLDIPALEVQL